MWDALSLRLEGSIVTLDPLAAGHADPLWEAAASDPDVWRYMTTRAGDSRELFGDWISTALGECAARTRIPFATSVAGRPAGSTSFLALRPEHRSVEIGYTWVASALWRSGANAEAKYLMLRQAFEEAGCLRVEFKTDAGNERARRALEALPAQFEGIHRKHMVVRGGERRDSAWYSVIDDDWPAVKANLERRIAAALATAR